MIKPKHTAFHPLSIPFYSNSTMILSQTHLGIAPLTWSNDDKPEIGKNNTFAQCVSEMALAGFAGCELGSKFPGELKTLQYELGLRQLKVANQWFTFELTTKSVDEVRPAFLAHVKKLRALGAGVVGGGEFARSIVGQEHIPACGVTPPARPILNAAEWKTFTTRLTELGKIAHNEGLSLCFHHHMGTCVETQAETERLLNDCDERYVALNYDSGHFYFAGDDPIAALDKFKTRVKHVHLKNVRPHVLKAALAGQYSFLKAVLAGVFTIPGDPEGCIDFPAIFKHLARVNYAGWMIVEAEQDPAKAHPLATALRARAYLKETLGH